VEGVNPGLLGLADDFDSNYSMDPANFDQQKGQVVISYSTAGAGLSQTEEFYNISFKLKAKPASGTTNITLSPRTIPDGTPFDSAYQSYTASYTGAVITITGQDLTPPVLSNVTSGSFPVGTSITATTNEDGFIYLVPADTAANKDAVQTAAQAANGATQAAAAGVPVQLTTSGFAAGSYLVYAVDAAGNLSAPSQIISLTAPTGDDKIHFQLNPSPIDAQVGDTIEVLVAILSLPEGFASAIITFGLDLNYDPSYLKLVGVNPGSIGEAEDFDSNYSMAPAIFDQEKGQVVISYSTTGTGLTQTGDFYILTLKLKAKPSSGTTNITLAPRTIPDGTPFDSNYKSYKAAYTGAVIAINGQVSDPLSSGPNRNTGGSSPVQAGTASNKDPAQPAASDADGLLPESSRDQQDNLMARGQFNDIQNHWARANIEKLVGLKILNGYSNGSFQPDKNIRPLGRNLISFQFQ
jgi:hypothetical protein